MRRSSCCRFAEGWAAVCLAAGLAGAAASAEEAVSSPRFQYHGFLSQGYLKSSGNNFYGKSRDAGGSFEYYELGLNGTFQIVHRLSVSAQVLARRAGNTEDDVRLDFAFLDYRFVDLGAARAGLRLGRVKNPFGLYNETRDVFATRPSILLPETVYLEGVGIRELLFSSDALQLYGDWDHDRHHTDFELNFGRSGELSRKTKENFLSGPFTIQGVEIAHFRLEHPVYAQVLHERDDTTSRVALSYVSYGQLIGFAPASRLPPILIEVQRFILSGQRNLERWTLTSEVSVSDFGIRFSTAHDRALTEGAYLQAQYRFSPEWTALVRHEASRGDLVTLGGSGSQARRHAYARDSTASVSWSPRPAWRLAAEFHDIHGTTGIPGLDNLGYERRQVALAVSTRQGGKERAPLARRAGHADLAALRLDQPPGEREAQAGPGVHLGHPGIELLEIGEQSPDVLAGDAHTGVLHLEPESGGVRRLRQRAYHDATALGRELERIREIVIQDLGEPLRVQLDAGQGRIDMGLALDRLGSGDGAQGTHHLADQRRQVHGLGLEAQLAGLDLRQIQHVVDQPQQVPGACQHIRQVLPLLVGDRADPAIVHQLRKADDAVERRAELV
jgi:hypothetical protein